jgi:hypothetical protein
MNKLILLFAVLALAFLTASCGDMVGDSSGSKCTTGKPCGNTCISRDKVCRQ